MNRYIYILCIYYIYICMHVHELLVPETQVVQSEGLLEVDAVDMEGEEETEAVLVKESDVVEQRTDGRSRSMPVDLSKVQVRLLRHLSYVICTIYIIINTYIIV